MFTSSKHTSFNLVVLYVLSWKDTEGIFNELASPTPRAKTRGVSAHHAILQPPGAEDDRKEHQPEPGIQNSNHRDSCQISASPIRLARPRLRIGSLESASPHPDAQDVNKWRGSNYLGESLMMIRAELREAVLPWYRRGETSTTY